MFIPIPIPIPIPGPGSLGNRDLQLQQLRKDIEYKQNFVHQKRQELTQKQTTNEHLAPIQELYAQETDRWKQQKKEEFDALSFVREYLVKLRNTGSLLESQQRQMDTDHQLVSQEMDKVQQQLDKLDVLLK